jgi:hypothetical protein
MTRSLRTLVLGAGRSTTRRVLLLLSAGLVLATTAVFATGLTVLTRTHETADTVRTRTAPAIQGILTAHAALVQADRAAVRSFTADADLVGPGEEFQTQIAVTSQSLTKVAEDNVAGARGSRDLQLIEGLLVTYTGLIAQADAQFRQPNGELLGTADLWSASYLLHRDDIGILAQLDELLAAQRQALDRQLATSAMTVGTVLVLALPILVLCVVLAMTHVFFRRRFRRWVNPGLVVATLALIALTWVVTRPLSATQHLEDSRGALYELVTEERARIAAQEGKAQQAMLELLSARECDARSSCGTTIERFFDAAPASASLDTTSDLADDTRTVDELNNTASATAGLEPLVYIFAIAVVIAAAFAFRPRLNEYRYR